MDSLFKAGEFIRTIEKSQGLSVSVIEEIAYSNGWIDKETLLACANKHGKSPYGEHLTKVAEGRIIAPDNKGY